MQALRQGVAEQVAAAGGRVDYVEVLRILKLAGFVKHRLFCRPTSAGKLVAVCGKCAGRLQSAR